MPWQGGRLLDENSSDRRGSSCEGISHILAKDGNVFNSFRNDAPSEIIRCVVRVY